MPAKPFSPDHLRDLVRVTVDAVKPGRRDACPLFRNTRPMPMLYRGADIRTSSRCSGMPT